ncbi:hypothetical protein EX30DRAFT_373964 [Ascodesmis nigricans]|uniref:Uncharacterized protein n=1 Tax=Ascodesmis nigricans TaxID=341454 RepID=A0A4S2MML7_9PEZI|nr:hypothetical protein EX30DRAFT_373964 [Ascodesmis nigricans]
MYSCVNQPRGCRGRVNVAGGRCDSCRQLNLKKPSIFSSTSTSFQRPTIDFSAFETSLRDR